MILLAGTNYDPAGAVSKSLASLLAMTAFDTTNLRLTFTCPRSGNVLVKMRTNMSGATTMSQPLLGVLDGATVRGRQVAMAALPGTALATTNIPLWAEFLVTGLTPGNSYTFDAAYGVETAVASTNIHYGGPNNTTTNDAFGGFAFEIWDPAPYVVDANGRLDISKVAGTSQTAGDLSAQLTTIDDYIDTEIATIVANTTANNVADAILDRSAGVETGLTVRQYLRLTAAALLGKASGFSGTSVVFRDTNDTKNRISTTVDSSGNRTAQTLDAT